MFDLEEEDLVKSMLGCADGPSSFNSVATQEGRKIVSCDPIYALPAVEVGERISESFDVVMHQLRTNASNFIWSQFKSPDECGHYRLEAMRSFLLDYEKGRKDRRYIEASLPHLPFGEGAFDLALCSHFLFTYSGALTFEFHREAIYELARVAREVRIFPIVDAMGQQVPFLELLITQLQEHGLHVEKKRVPYEFQKGADQMLRILRA